MPTDLDANCYETSSRRGFGGIRSLLTLNRNITMCRSPLGGTGAGFGTALHARAELSVSPGCRVGVAQPTCV